MQKFTDKFVRLYFIFIDGQLIPIENSTHISKIPLGKTPRHSFVIFQTDYFKCKENYFNCLYKLNFVQEVYVYEKVFMTLLLSELHNLLLNEV